MNWSLCLPWVLAQTAKVQNFAQIDRPRRNFAIVLCLGGLQLVMHKSLHCPRCTFTGVFLKAAHSIKYCRATYFFSPLHPPPPTHTQDTWTEFGFGAPVWYQQTRISTRTARRGGARRPPKTNEGTETAFRHDHASISEKGNFSWGVNTRKSSTFRQTASSGM